MISSDAAATRARGDSPVVLVGFAEAMAAIETTWSLQEAGFRVAAFRRSGTRSALRRIPYVELHDVPAPEDDALGAIAAVRRVIGYVKPSVLLPLDDAAVWICGHLEDPGVDIAGPTGDAVELALDKGLQLREARRSGLLVPPTTVVQDLDEVDTVEEPVVVKPARALYEVGGRLVRPTGVVCATSHELRAARAKLRHRPLLVQPFTRGVGEGLFGHASSQGVFGWSAHQRVRMVNPQGSASSACRSRSVDDQLAGPSERFLKAAGWNGMFMLEFLRDSAGKPWFMELNGRAWGSMALARRRGFEYPAWAATAALRPDFVPVAPADPPEKLCRNLGLELVHLMFVARGPRSVAQTQWPRLARAVRDVSQHRSGDCLYNWKPSQPRVLLADTLGTVGEYLGKMTGRQS
jgi:hypothetical protein